MEKPLLLLLLLCCLLLPLGSSLPLYPSIRFGQRHTSILMTSSIKKPAVQLKGRNTSHPAEIRSGRHADAIFTNSYRKVLGQISARKFLETVIGKRLQGESESYLKRQSGVFEGTSKKDLTSIQNDEQYKAVHKHVPRHPC